MTSVLLHVVKAGLCRMSEHGEGNVVNIYAQLDSQEMPIPKDLSDYWQDPSSYFLISGDLFTGLPVACCHHQQQQNLVCTCTSCAAY